MRDRSCEMQSASLPGSAGPWVTFLRTTCFSVFRRALARSIASCAMLLADLGVLVEPQRERVVRGALDEAGGLARGQALLGLAAELRVGHLQRQHEGDAVPHVFRRQLDAARQQVAEVAELAQRIGEAGAQAVDVGAALRGRDQVDVAFLHQLAIGHPGDGPVDDLGVLASACRRTAPAAAARAPPSSPRR